RRGGAARLPRRGERRADARRADHHPADPRAHRGRALGPGAVRPAGAARLRTDRVMTGEDEAPQASRDTPRGEITALLGAGTEFAGKLVFDGKVRIDGKFKGEIVSDDTLVVGESAEVDAEIDVSVVIVRGGTVRGNIRAKSAVEVYAPARVIGNIHSPEVFID